MAAKSYFRGWPIFYSETQKEWLFLDDSSPVKDTYHIRPCGECEAGGIGGGPDPCLGKLPGVKNACCGHGTRDEAYIQFNNGTIIRGFDRIEIFNNNPKDSI